MTEAPVIAVTKQNAAWFPEFRALLDALHQGRPIELHERKFRVIKVEYDRDADYFDVTLRPWDGRVYETDPKAVTPVCDDGKVLPLPRAA